MNTEADTWTTRETAAFLRLLSPDPRTGEPDPTRPDPLKVHALAFRDPTFPRPIKLGRHNRYIVAEVKKWRDDRPRGGPSAPPPAGARRGRKPEAVAR